MLEDVKYSGKKKEQSRGKGMGVPMRSLHY